MVITMKKTKLEILKITINIIRKIKIYIAYFKIKFLNEIQYKLAAFAGILTQFAWGGMYIMLYSTFLKNSTPSDYTIQQMSTYIWLQQAFFSLYNLWSIDKDILEQCQNGNIAMELIRPIDVYSIWHAKTLGKKLAMVTLRAIPILLICSMPFLKDYKLLLPTDLGMFILFVIVLVLSIILMMSYIMLMYISIMKTVSPKGIRVTFQMIMEACSGSLIPISFMPNTIIEILKYTPFYYMQNTALNIYNGYISDITEIIKIIGIQLIWIMILTIIGRRIMKKQLSKIVVQGG